MRRPVLQLLALAVAAVFAAPVAAVEAGGAETETLHGTLQGLYVETFRESHVEPRFSLLTRSGEVSLDLGDQSPEELSGAVVDVTGRRVGKTLHVADARAGRDIKVRKAPTSEALVDAASLDATSPASDTTVTADSIATAAVVTKNIAVILVNFRDDTARPFTTSAVQTAFFTGSTSAKRFFEEESKGRMSVTGSVFGWYTLDTTSTTCDWTTWTTMANNAVAANGGSLSGYTNFAYVIPATAACGWAGVAYINGSKSVLNNTISVQVITHELGHNFGLNHANALYCTANGSRVSIAAPESCESKGYQDPFSTMGNNALRHNHGAHLGALGWVASSETVLAAPGNQYTISPYFGSGAVKLVRVPRGSGATLDLDFRATYGAFDTFTADSPAVAGVTIRLSESSTSRVSHLVDTTPATADLKDAPLLVGKSLRDPVSGLTIKTVSVSSAGVVVSVTEGVAPSAPGSLAASATSTPKVDLSWTAATDNVGVKSYKVTRNGSAVATVNAPATTWSDSSVGYGTAYTYTVAAVDTSGNTGAAASKAVTTPANPSPTPTPTPTPAPTATPSPDPTPTPEPTASPDPSPTPVPSATPAPGPEDPHAPSAPEPLSATAGITTVTLTWGAATGKDPIGGYEVTRNGSKVATLDPNLLTWKDSRRAPSTSYTYAVTAIDTAFRASAASSITIRTKADTIRPSRPRYFRVAARYGGGYVKFAWSRSTDNVKVARYRIYREGRSTYVRSTTGTSIKMWVRKGYRYYVRAIDSSGNRSYGSNHVRGR
ncbi:MAG TPA: M12 family metallo-peptidase [Candidatus Limnocylindrales bacterium]|nr:M12 family metallo-peptidase [Candidatus Limnocylindrales bacterium]